MDILKRNLAPLTQDAWNEIDEQAGLVLRSSLTARKFVDVDGPKGMDFGAIPLGRINVPGNQKKGEVQYGIHQMLPLMEVRIPFKLNIWEMDNISRGAKDANLEPLEAAAAKIARFEERAVYYGFDAANMTGLKESRVHNTMSCPQNAQEALCNIPDGLRVLKEAAISGPYDLVVNPLRWQKITSYANGYPLQKQLEEMLKGSIIVSPNIDEMFLVSRRGGDFRLTLGMDLSIGYEAHDNKEVTLYFTESFAFQVFEPKAFVVFE